MRLDSPDLDKSLPKLTKYLASLRAIAPKMLADAAHKDAADRAISYPQAWSDPARSPITTKKAYFDEHLVGEIEACLGENHDWASVRTCLAGREASQQYVRSLDWIHYPPSPRPESGVRESPYRLTKDLDFLDLGRHADAPLWPFDFMVQITFDSPPEFTSPNEFEFDVNPFEFPLINEQIHRDVAAAVASGKFDVPDSARVLADMREFAVLQRLFRLAFDGKLGTGFPLDRLIALGQATTHEKPATVRTLTWNVQPAQYNRLKAQGFQAQLVALGYERDVQQVNAIGERCPGVAP